MYTHTPIEHFIVRTLEDYDSALRIDHGLADSRVWSYGQRAAVGLRDVVARHIEADFDRALQLGKRIDELDKGVAGALWRNKHPDALSLIAQNGEAILGLDGRPSPAYLDRWLREMLIEPNPLAQGLLRMHADTFARVENLSQAQAAVTTAMQHPRLFPFVERMTGQHVSRVSAAQRVVEQRTAILGTHWKKIAEAARETDEMFRIRRSFLAITGTAREYAPHVLRGIAKTNVRVKSERMITTFLRKAGSPYGVGLTALVIGCFVLYDWHQGKSKNEIVLNAISASMPLKASLVFDGVRALA